MLVRSSGEAIYAGGASVKRSMIAVHVPLWCKGGWCDPEEESELLISHHFRDVAAGLDGRLTSICIE